MNYNNGFPVGYQYYQPQPVAAPTQQQPQSNPGLIWVQGEAGAKAYAIAPNTTVMLMDSEAQTFYIKSADASGMPQPLRAFDYTERVQTGQAPSPDGDRLSKIESRIAEIEKRLPEVSDNA